MQAAKARRNVELAFSVGKRLADADFAASNWDLERWLWLPALDCQGPFKITPFQHVLIISGSGPDPFGANVDRYPLSRLIWRG